MENISQRILICRDRYWTDSDYIRSILWAFPKETVIINGDCRGVDKLADKISNNLGMTTIRYPANWEKYGRGAGPRRNTQMLVEGKPDLGIAFHNDFENSKGTKNMVNQALNGNRKGTFT